MRPLFHPEGVRSARDPFRRRPNPLPFLVLWQEDETGVSLFAFVMCNRVLSRVRGAAAERSGMISSRSGGRFGRIQQVRDGSPCCMAQNSGSGWGRAK